MKAQRTIDERVDAALHVLSNAGPQPGMEQRIQAALHSAGASRHGPGALKWLRWPAMSCAAALVLLFVAVFLSRRSVLPPTLAHATLVPATMSRAREMQDTHESQRRALQPASLTSRLRSPAFEGIRRTEHTQKPTTADGSLPEPPMPLTEQERLLLRLVHHGDPVQLAQLVPDARKAALQHEQADVSRFFTPPSPLEGQQQE